MTCSMVSANQKDEPSELSVELLFCQLAILKVLGYYYYYCSSTSTTSTVVAQYVHLLVNRTTVFSAL